MTNKRTTKQQLVASVVLLFMCFSMLLGTTFAWFTDSATSAGNKIVAGTLDVQLLMHNGTDYIDISDENAPVIGDGNALFGVGDTANENATATLWEPGKTQVVYLAIKNNGNLDLKYQLAINVRDTDGDQDLYKALKYAIKDGAQPKSVTEWTDDGAKAVKVGNNVEGNNVVLEKGETKYFAFSVHMNEDAGNEFMGGSIEFDIKVLATQVASEEDSFGKDYDEDAPLLVWDGSVDTSWYDASKTEYELSSPARLAGLAKLVNEGNSFAGKSIKLAADMDLNNLAWTAIGNGTANFNGKFYGDGFTIYNLNVSGTKGVGLIGFAGNAAHIEGVHIVGADVSGENSVGAVLGYGYLAADCLKNCTVEDAVVYAAAGSSKEDGDKVGAVAGWTSNGNIIGNTAINCEIYGCRDIGGIVGYVNGENRAVEVSGNTVEKVTVNVIKATDYQKTLGSNVNDTVGRTGNQVTVQDNSGKIEKKGDVVSASTTEDLKAALENGGEVTVVAGTYSFPTASIKAGTTLNCKPGTVFEGNSKLNINGATVVGATFSNPNGTAVDQTINGVFKNCVFDGSNGLRWCYAGDTVVFENCVFSGDVYGVHFDGGANEVVFRDCTFSGFNAMGGAITNLTMEGCTFKSNGRSGYNGINLWGNTDMIDCTFVFDGTAGTEWVDACGENKTYTFTNCVVTDGEKETPFEKVVSYNGTGNTIIIDGVNFVTNSDMLKAVIESGATKVLLAAGDYSVRFTNNTAFNVDDMTIVGMDGANLDIASTEVSFGRIQGNNVIFENINFTDNTVGATGKATYNKCTFAGRLECSGNNSETIANNCVIGDVHTSSDIAAGNAYFNNCTINKAEYGKKNDITLTFTGCKIGELKPWNVNTTLNNCDVTTMDLSGVSTAVILVNGDRFVGNNDALKAAIESGATKVLLADGEYDLNGNQRDGLTLIGVGENVKMANTTKYASGKSVGAIWKAINLEKMTVTNTVYTMADGGNATFTNVNFAAGFRQGYGKNVVFTDCTFGSNSEGYALHFQTDSASAGGEIKLNGCEFEGGKVHLGGSRSYAFTGCDFAAGTDFQVWSNITLEGCTVDGVEVTAENAATLFPALNLAKVTIK